MVFHLLGFLSRRFQLRSIAGSDAVAANSATRSPSNFIYAGDGGLAVHKSGLPLRFHWQGHSEESPGGGGWKTIKLTCIQVAALFFRMAK